MKVNMIMVTHVALNLYVKVISVNNKKTKRLIIN